MADTTNPTATVATVQRRPRIKDAIASGICDGTTAAVKMVSSTAEVISAVAVRVKLNNVETAADILDVYGAEKVTAAQALIEKL